jgi:hypothetical protein
MAPFSLAWHQSPKLSPQHPVSDSNQAGLSIFTPNRLSNLWNKYSQKELSLEQLKVEWALESDEEED